MNSFDNRFLENKIISFSIANNPDLAQKGFGPEHLKDLSLELGRYLLNSGAQLAFGHNTVRDGYGALLAELNQYYSPTHSARKRSINYLTWPIASRLQATDLLELEEMSVDVRKLDCPTSMLKEVHKDSVSHFFPSQETKDKEKAAAASTRRYHWTLCLTEMREKMISETHAHVLAGGKTSGFSGILPGILEEARLACNAGHPIYIMGVFGGMAKNMAKALLGEKPDVFGTNYHTATKGYKTAYSEYSKALNLTDDLLAENLDYFQNLGVDGLSKLNGLSTEDNLRLFETPHVSEMVRLVLKGLDTIWPSTENLVPG